MKIGVVGASGFLGSNVMNAGLAMGLNVRSVKAAHVVAENGRTPKDRTGAWEYPAARQLDTLTSAVAGFDVIVNAAGLARPGSGNWPALVAANVVLPVGLALACRQADVRRLVHVSTAAVQGRLDPLDETDHRAPFSPYSSSKAEAERRLQNADAAEVPDELILYRPASVHGPGRAITRRLCRLARGRLIMLSGTGDQPLPVALVENVAAGILFSATASAATPVVVQPWEGLTTRRLFELLGSRSFLSVPAIPMRHMLQTVRQPAEVIPRVASTLRTLEILFTGQRLAESSLTRAGFVPPVGPEGWSALVDATAGAVPCRPPS